MATPESYGLQSEGYLEGAKGFIGRGGDVARGSIGLGGAMRRTYLGGYMPTISRLPQESSLNAPAILGQATADVSSAFDRSLGASQRDLARMGVSPSSGRWGGLEQQWALTRAAAEAGAKTRARRMIREEDWARKLGLADYGAGMANSAANIQGAGFGQARQTAGMLGDLSAMADTGAYEEERLRMAERTNRQQQLDALTARLAEQQRMAAENAQLYRGRRSMRGVPAGAPVGRGSLGAFGAFAPGATEWNLEKEKRGI